MAHMVVGTDGSEQAGRALRWAAREANLRDFSLVAVMAWGYLDQHHADGTDHFDPKYTEADAAAALDTYVVDALGDDAAAPVERRLVLNLAPQALLGESKGAELLVVGARGLGGFRGLLLGSVSQACIAHATCPVAVVHGEARPLLDQSPERIVVGIDGSEAAQWALRWAIRESELRRAQLDVVHSWHIPYAGMYPSAIETFDPSLIDEAARQTLHQAIADEDTSGLAAPPRQILATRGAAGAILDAAGGADLIVLGSRGLGGFRGLLIGSVSGQVANHAKCSVVIVPKEV